MSFLEEYRRLAEEHDRKNTTETKRTLLDLLCNGQPYDTETGTMEVQILDRTTGKATRWTPYLDIRDNDWWIANSNNRSIGIAEVVFDIDPHEKEEREDFERRIAKTKQSLLDHNATILGDYATGGRGRHIHTIIPQLIHHKKHTVAKLKLALLKKFGADQAKASTRAMILIEGSTNSKTGNRKRMMT